MSHTSNSTNSEQPAHPDGGCRLLKASLSAYLDGELTQEARLAADAHVLACAPCRRLLERAERLDETLREKFESDLDDARRAFDAAPVDTTAMQDRVFAAVGRAEPSRAASGVRWIRRFSIAALVALSFLTGALLASRASESDRLDATAGAIGTRLVSLDPNERQLLYSTSVILSNLRREGFEHSDASLQLREVARYDDLVERLDAILEKLPEDERPTVALARETISFLLDASDDPERWEALRRDLERTQLDHRVDLLSEA